MNLCSENHDEVCHEGRNCPACRLVSERDELKEEIASLKKDIDDLKEQIP